MVKMIQYWHYITTNEMAKIIWKRKPIINTLKVVATLCCLGFLLVAFMPNPEPCNCDKNSELYPREVDPGGVIRNNSHIVYKNRHKLAVIVPYRDRMEEMLQFVPHMHKYLNNKGINHKIYIINQIDDLRYVRASIWGFQYVLLVPFLIIWEEGVISNLYYYCQVL